MKTGKSLLIALLNLPISKLNLPILIVDRDCPSSISFNVIHLKTVLHMSGEYLEIRNFNSYERTEV